MTHQDRDSASAFPSEDAKRKLAQPDASLKPKTRMERRVWSQYFTGKRSPTLRQCQQVAATLRLDALNFVASLRVATQASLGSTEQ